MQRVSAVNAERARWFTRIVSSTTVAQIVERVEMPRGTIPIAVHGAAGSSSTVLAGAVSLAAHRSLLLVTAHRDEADEAAAELESLGVPVLLFPALVPR